MKNTHHNNELTIKDVNKNVSLRGWVSKVRNLGGLIFIDLRDREGITQIMVNPENKNYKLAETIKSEFVIYVEGKVIERVSKNKNIKTGEIEVEATTVEILNTANLTPLIIADETDALEDTRLKYRYLDLRRPVMQNSLITRHKAVHAIRETLFNDGFIDVETPLFGKSTPEGARDYLVPSRLNKGQFYALPQSPQLYKQLLMVSGLEKYYQFAKCLRDEDLRSDRQPEFTQLDIEMSFVGEEDIYALMEKLMSKVFKDVINVEIDSKFKRMNYDEAMARYGSDKPDTRFDMELIELTSTFAKSDFSVFANAEKVNCINLKSQAANLSRKKIDELTEYVKRYQAKGLAWLKYTDNTYTGPIAKFFKEDELKELTTKANVENGDILLFVADKTSVVRASLGALRTHLAKQYDLIDEKLYNFLWVVNFPMFEYSEEEDRYVSVHHPFTKVRDEDVEKLSTSPQDCYTYSYDLVCNGYELAGGSLRISDQELQSKVFQALGFSDKEITDQFGFFVDALKFGTPPHGGIAMGLERLTMLLIKSNNIRDVIAFPKTASGRCLMSDAPNFVSEKQLAELKISTEK